MFGSNVLCLLINIFNFPRILCIGPGSLSDCITNMGVVNALGQDNYDNYNIVSIDQRGTGYVQILYFLYKSDNVMPAK